MALVEGVSTKFSFIGGCAYTRSDVSRGSTSTRGTDGSMTTSSTVLARGSVRSGGSLKKRYSQIKQELQASSQAPAPHRHCQDMCVSAGWCKSALAADTATTGVFLQQHSDSLWVQRVRWVQQVHCHQKVPEGRGEASVKSL